MDITAGEDINFCDRRYCAIKLGGPRRGILFTGLSGGPASSTAVTLHFPQMTRNRPSLAKILSIGALLACANILPRMLLIASALNSDLL